VLTIAVAAGGAGVLGRWRLPVVVLHALKLLCCWWNGGRGAGALGLTLADSLPSSCNTHLRLSTKDDRTRVLGCMVLVQRQLLGVQDV
jgi:hypothetical protein